MRGLKREQEGVLEIRVPVLGGDCCCTLHNHHFSFYLLTALPATTADASGAIACQLATAASASLTL